MNNPVQNVKNPNTIQKSEYNFYESKYENLKKFIAMLTAKLIERYGKSTVHKILTYIKEKHYNEEEKAHILYMIYKM